MCYRVTQCIHSVSGTCKDKLNTKWHLNAQELIYIEPVEIKWLARVLPVFLRSKIVEAWYISLNWGES